MIKLKHILTEQSKLDPQREQEFLEKYVRRSHMDPEARVVAGFKELYNRLEDASRSDADKATEAAIVLKGAKRAINTPEAVIQSAIQSIDNSNVLTQVKSMLGTGNLEAWFDRIYGFDPNRQWHRGSTIADKFVEFGSGSY